jgi:hypothetical protein
LCTFSPLPVWKQQQLELWFSAPNLFSIDRLIGQFSHFLNLLNLAIAFHNVAGSSIILQFLSELDKHGAHLWCQRSYIWNCVIWYSIFSILAQSMSWTSLFLTVSTCWTMPHNVSSAE